MKTRIGLLLVGLLVAVGCAQAQGPQVTPLSQKELVELMKAKGTQEAATAVNQRGVDFETTPEIAKKLRKAAKGDDAFVALVKSNGPEGRMRAIYGDGPLPTPEELQSIRAAQNELVPEKLLQMVDEFVKTYPKSVFLTHAYLFGAGAYQAKGDIGQVIAYLDKSLAANPDNILSLTMKASMLARPQMMNVGDSLKEKRLDEAQADAMKALKLIEEMKPNPGESDEMLAKRKSALASGAHAALGMVHLQRAGMGLTGLDQDELSKAEQEYRSAVALSDPPNAEDYYRLGETLIGENKKAEALAAFIRASELSEGMPLKSFADRKIEQMKQQNPGLQPAEKP